MTEPDEDDPLAEATPGQKLILILLMFAGAAVLVVVLSVLLALLFR